MPFWTFQQNNSGGIFTHEPENGLGYSVCIEADTDAQATAKAESIGIYFDGVASGQDCACCGDRWYKAFGPFNTPSRWVEGNPLEGGWGIPAYIHYANGVIEAVPDKAEEVKA